MVLYSSGGVKRGEVRVEDASFRWGGTADAAAATLAGCNAGSAVGALVAAVVHSSALELCTTTSSHATPATAT